MKWAVLFIVLFCSPALAQDDPVVRPPIVVVGKPVWKQRLHKIYRGARVVCIKVKPFMEVAGATAQVASVFLGKR